MIRADHQLDFKREGVYIYRHESFCVKVVYLNHLKSAVYVKPEIKEKHSFSIQVTK